MTEPALQLHGIKKEPDGSATEVVAVVFAPEKSTGHSVWSCTVRCPAFFSSDKRIAGVDADQALELAEMFVLEIFKHHDVPLKKGD